MEPSLSGYIDLDSEEVEASQDAAWYTALADGGEELGCDCTGLRQDAVLAHRRAGNVPAERRALALLRAARMARTRPRGAILGRIAIGLRPGPRATRRRHRARRAPARAPDDGGPSDGDHAAGRVAASRGAHRRIGGGGMTAMELAAVQAATKCQRLMLDAAHWWEIRRAQARLQAAVDALGPRRRGGRPGSPRDRVASRRGGAAVTDLKQRGRARDSSREPTGRNVRMAAALDSNADRFELLGECLALAGNPAGSAEAFQKARWSRNMAACHAGRGSWTGGES